VTLSANTTGPEPHVLTATSSADGADVHGYPRPLLRRPEWIPLNGPWSFAMDPQASWSGPLEVEWDGTIEVPFAPEAEKSGIGDQGFFLACWYRLVFKAPALEPNQRLLLHFQAVDHSAQVWVDGALAVAHEGGYTPFEVDITDYLRSPHQHELVVRAFDDPADLCKPRGKQDWQLEPHSIWYPRTTGIWQTVWSEVVPRTRVLDLLWVSNVERWELALQAFIEPGGRTELRLGVKLRVHGELIADDTYRVIAGEVSRRIALSDPGIDDFRNELLWSPDRPTLIDVELELWGERGELLDRVTTYTALRGSRVQGDRFLLNGRPLPLRLVLDQGYWPETGMTAPSDAALKRDVELAKAMGFNGVRKHQKVENPRFLYWADKLGLMVWEEMPSAYRFTNNAVERVAREWTDVIRRDRSHPCIIAWVPFNESWGVPNLPDSSPERHYVQALYYLTKTLDPSRPVIGNDGWESVATDLIGIHDYDANVARIAKRYHAEEVRLRLFRHERPGGRVLALESSHTAPEHPIVLSEFGGISLVEERTWGYSTCKTADELRTRYVELLGTVRKLELLCGFCYTQFADTYQEANGLLYADRTPKFPLKVIRAATSGELAHEVQLGEQAEPGEEAR